MKKVFVNIAGSFRAFPRMVLFGVIVGAVCGLIGSAFHYSIDFATNMRAEHPWLIFLLPLGGAAIVLLYSLLRQSITLGTDNLFKTIHKGDPLPFAMAPLIYLGTFITHLFGGSAGREGAALQLGGGIGNRIGVLLKLKDEEKRMLTMMGMGALFAALFGTPVTSTLFVMEVLSMGHLVYSSFVPCMVASLTAYSVSLALNVKPEAFFIRLIPALDWANTLRVGALAIVCALLSLGFCYTMRASEHAMKKYIKNPYLRAVCGGVLIVILTLIVGTRDYNGAGGSVIKRAIEEGSARSQDFILKLIFTAITISSGFKGGEIVPTFYFGATFGCVFGPLIGLDASFAAAVALVAVFCGNTNCPIASIFLAIELFGGKAVPMFALACAISYMLSGNVSLYHSQLISNKGLKLGMLILPENGADSAPKK